VSLLNCDVRHFTYVRQFVLFTSEIRRPLHHSRIGLAVASRKSLAAELSAWPADFARFMNVEQATDWATCKREVLRTSSAARTKAHSQKNNRWHEEERVREATRQEAPIHYQSTGG